jgi:hypothetical protein
VTTSVSYCKPGWMDTMHVSAVAGMGATYAVYSTKYDRWAIDYLVPEHFNAKSSSVFPGMLSTNDDSILADDLRNKGSFRMIG